MKHRARTEPGRRLRVRPGLLLAPWGSARARVSRATARRALS